jgi:hypothetical protein
MLADGWHRHVVERGHHFLREPEVFILVAHFHAALRVAGCRDKGQVFGRGGTNEGYLVFLRNFRWFAFAHSIPPPLFIDIGHVSALSVNLDVSNSRPQTATVDARLKLEVSLIYTGLQACPPDFGLQRVGRVAERICKRRVKPAVAGRNGSLRSPQEPERNGYGQFDWNQLRRIGRRP